MSSYETHMVPTEDRRELEVLVSRTDGFPLVFHHPVPGSAVPFPVLERPAAERGLSVISYSRAGCGTSTSRSGGRSATVADDATDTAAILTTLGLGDFVTLGWSGGGVRALSCAALLPDRCRAAAVLACPAPPGAEGLEPARGMGDPDELAMRLRQATDDQVLEALQGVLGPTLTGDIGAYAVACVRHSLDQGVSGWREDDLTQSRHWGFELGPVAVPVCVWHGTEDRNVPVPHARWLGEHIPGAHAHVVEGEDHVSVMNRIAEVLDDLVERAGLNHPVPVSATG